MRLLMFQILEVTDVLINEREQVFYLKQKSNPQNPRKIFAIWIFFRVQNLFHKTFLKEQSDRLNLLRPLNLKINFVNHISRILKRKTL